MRSPKNRGCAGKKRYRSQQYAESVIGRLVAAGALARHLNAYLCRHCHAWHVGHVPGSGSKR